MLEFIIPVGVIAVGSAIKAIYDFSQEVNEPSATLRLIDKLAEEDFSSWTITGSFREKIYVHQDAGVLITKKTYNSGTKAVFLQISNDSRSGYEAYQTPHGSADHKLLKAVVDKLDKQLAQYSETRAKQKQKEIGKVLAKRVLEKQQRVLAQPRLGDRGDPEQRALDYFETTIYSGHKSHLKRPRNYAC